MDHINEKQEAEMLLNEKVETKLFQKLRFRTQLVIVSWT